MIKNDMAPALLLEDQKKARYLEEITFLCAWLLGEEKQMAMDLVTAVAREEDGEEVEEVLTELRLRVWPIQASVAAWVKEDRSRAWEMLLSLVLPKTRILLLRLAKQLDTNDIAEIWRAPQANFALFQAERAEIERLWPWLLARLWQANLSSFAQDPKQYEKTIAAFQKRWKKQPAQVEAEMEAMMQLKNAL